MRGAWGLFLGFLLVLTLAGVFYARPRRRGAPSPPARPAAPAREADELARETLQLFADSVVFTAEETFLASPAFKKQLAVSVLCALLAERRLPVPPAPVLAEAVERAEGRLRLLAGARALL